MERTAEERSKFKNIFKGIKEPRIRWKGVNSPRLPVKAKMEDFLNKYCDNWDIKHAALAVGISPARPHVWKNKWPEFRLAMDQAANERLADGIASLFRNMESKNPKVAGLATFYYLNSSPEAKNAGWGQHNVIEHRVTLTKEEKDAQIDEIEQAALAHKAPKRLNEGVDAIEGEIEEIERIEGEGIVVIQKEAVS